MGIGKSLRGAVRSVLFATVLRRNTVLPFRRGLRYVFVYHDIAARDALHFDPSYCTEPARFREQVGVITSLFRVVSLHDLLQAHNHPAHLAAITFDDGFRSVHTVAGPWLRELGLPFAVFVNRRALEGGGLWYGEVVLRRRDRGWLQEIHSRYLAGLGVGFAPFCEDPLSYLVTMGQFGDDDADLGRLSGDLYMGPAELRDLHRDGVVVGSHTVSHPILARCSDARLRREIGDNRAYLEALLGEPVTHFAIPFGFEGTYDARGLALARAEHRYVYSTRRHCFRSIDTAHEDFVIPRIGLGAEAPGDIMAAVNLPLFVDRSVSFER